MDFASPNREDAVHKSSAEHVSGDGTGGFQDKETLMSLKHPGCIPGPDHPAVVLWEPVHLPEPRFFTHTTSPSTQPAGMRRTGKDVCAVTQGGSG